MEHIDRICLQFLAYTYMCVPKSDHQVRMWERIYFGRQYGAPGLFQRYKAARENGVSKNRRRGWKFSIQVMVLHDLRS